MSDLQADSTPGAVQINDSGLEVLVHVVTPHEWLTLAQLRHWGAFLVTLADENEPTPEIDEMAGILETAAALGSAIPRAMARTLHNSGYRLERAAEGQRVVKVTTADATRNREPMCHRCQILRCRIFRDRRWQMRRRRAARR